jgi:WD40 repeat protein
VTGQGQVVVETDDPDVKVVVKQREQQIAIIDPKADREVTLKAGHYQVDLVPEKFGLAVSAKDFALTRGGKQVVRVRWEPPAPVQTLVCPEAVWGAQFCLDGSHVITAGGNRIENGKWVVGADFALRLWDGKTGREIRQFKDHTELVRALAVSGDGKRAVSAGGENRNAGPDWTLRLWDLETGQLIRRFDDKHTDVVSSVAYSADGKRIVSASSDQSLRLWDAETGQEIRCLDQGKTVYWQVDISRDGKHVLSGSKDGQLRLWDADTGIVLRSLDACKDWGPVKLSPDGRFALTQGLTVHNHGNVELWDLEKKLLIRQFSHDSGWAVASGFSADGKRFLTYGSDGTVRLRDVNGKELCRFPPLDVPQDTLKIVSIAALSPDGRFAVAATWGGTVRIWKLPE